MPWRTAMFSESVAAGVSQRLTLGPKIITPCYMDSFLAWTTPFAGSSEPDICVHWLLDDEIPTSFGDPRIVPPWGYQANTPSTRSPNTPEEGILTPVCAWAPEPAQRLLFIYEGGGIPALTYGLTVTYWEP